MGWFLFQKKLPDLAYTLQYIHAQYNQWLIEGGPFFHARTINYIQPLSWSRRRTLIDSETIFSMLISFRHVNKGRKSLNSYLYDLHCVKMPQGLSPS